MPIKKVVLVIRSSIAVCRVPSTADTACSVLEFAVRQVNHSKVSIEQTDGRLVQRTRLLD